MADVSPPAIGASTSGSLRRRHMAGIFRIEDEWERPGELPDRDTVRHQPGLLRPDMQVETRWLHGEGRCTAVGHEVERDLVCGAGCHRADGAAPAHGDGPVVVAADHALDIVDATNHA